MLILLEHYKLQLTLFLPKVCLVVRKAQKKGKNKLEETLAKSKRQQSFPSRIIFLLVLSLFTTSLKVYRQGKTG